MKTTDIENIYAGLSWEEFKVKQKEYWAEYLKDMNVFNQDIAAIKVKLKRLVSGMSRFFNKTKTVLSPMTCRTISPKNPTKMPIEKWRKYIRDERRFIHNQNWLQDQIAMEELLVEAQTELINHK